MTRNLGTVPGAFLVIALSIGGHCNNDNTVTGADPTATPVPPGAPTPTPPMPTPTPSGSATRTVNISGFQFTDLQSGTSTTTVHVGDTVIWQWVGGFHSTTSGPCPPCSASGTWNSGDFSPPHDFRFTFNQAGTFDYYCDIHLASMTGTVIVTP